MNERCTTFEYKKFESQYTILKSESTNALLKISLNYKHHDQLLGNKIDYLFDGVTYSLPIKDQAVRTAAHMCNKDKSELPYRPEKYARRASHHLISFLKQVLFN